MKRVKRAAVENDGRLRRPGWDVGEIYVHGVIERRGPRTDPRPHPRLKRPENARFVLSPAEARELAYRLLLAAEKAAPLSRASRRGAR